MDFLRTSVIPHFNYWIYVILMMIGLWAMIGKNNLIKKLIGMSIFQTAIILFYVSIGVKTGADIPIPAHHAHHDEAAAGAGAREEEDKLDPDAFANPLPHVLMLTAIVVGVATLGVALAISQSIHKDFGTLEEDEILEKIKASTHDG
ncbi:MAG: cation:proton antiporter subunit C [Verrucomicrobiae bacterium]|nr:cation:proton antiporter subunit C [Verrucomicrobiae bacterium]MCP5539212.1 cation:proton antiporter subunit C [Akkermansiaceae bacterium]MCP5549865.1 cation:proton antiporter subunit C [Akkermansiaceae bacterium]